MKEFALVRYVLECLYRVILLEVGKSVGAIEKEIKEPMANISPLRKDRKNNYFFTFGGIYCGQSNSGRNGRDGAIEV